ncbi:type IV pilus assembly protein FimV [Acinetobacter pittii]
MTVYNKLKIAIFTIMSSPSIYAITLDPIQIQSAPGDLLYAEMNFQQADPNATLQVSLATPEDLSALGVTHQPPGNLNFYTRQNGQGSGVIVITSSRPIIDPELNIVVKISEGSATRLQHIKTVIQPSPIKKTENNERTLSPQFIVNEKDIALNLPESTRYASPTSASTTNNSNGEHSLNINAGTAPAVNTNSSNTLSANPSTQVAQQVTTATTPDQTEIKPTSAKIPTNNSPKTPVQKLTAQKKSVPQKALNQNPVKKQSLSSYKGPAASGKYIVQRNESLWSIANRIAAKTQQPVAKVMHDIQKQNRHAFIQGDVNRLRQGVALNLAHSPATQSKHNKSKTDASTTKSPSSKAKYRLQQAEMSIVAENSPNSMHGSAKKSTQQSQNNTELAVKVMTTREKTVTLQRNVTELSQTLRLKDQRIQLLNARLAELQQQLKAQQQTHKQKH